MSSCSQHKKVFSLPTIFDRKVFVWQNMLNDTLQGTLFSFLCALSLIESIKCNDIHVELFIFNLFTLVALATGHYFGTLEVLSPY